MGLDSLADEIIWNILARVSTLDLKHVQCVCKRWKSIIEQPSFRQLQSSCSASNPNNRVLIVPQVDRLFSIDETRIVKLELVYPRSEKSGPVLSHKGLLCYIDKFEGIIVMNPFTNRHLPLFDPDDSGRQNRVHACGFLFDPTTNFYKVMILVFRDRGPSLGEFMILDSGSKGWRSMGEPPSCIDIFRGSRVLVNERLHWISSSQHMRWDMIVSFDPVNETFSTIKLPPDYSRERRDVLLMAFDGKLCMLIYDAQGKTFYLRLWIMKEYGVEESWVNEFNLEHAIPFDVQHRYLRVYLVGVDNGKVLLQLNKVNFFFYDLWGQHYELLRLPMKTLKEKWGQVLPINIEDMIASFHVASLCSIPS